MTGIILDFNTQTGEGIISAQNDRRYEFTQEQFKSSDTHPSINMNVDFTPENGFATEIYALEVDDSTLVQNYSDKMIEAFVAKPSKTTWYQNSFSKFNINGVDAMKWNWSWWAFAGGFLYLLYRKQYLPSIVLFLISITLGFIPGGGLLVMILSGGYASYFVYKGYKTKLIEIESNVQDEDKRIQTMSAIGGYHQWVIFIYVLFTFVSIMAAFSYIMVSAISIN